MTIPARANSASASSCMRPLESAIVSLFELLGTDLHLLLLLAHLASLAESRGQIAVDRDGLRSFPTFPINIAPPFGNGSGQPIEREGKSDRRFRLAKVGDEVVVAASAANLDAPIRHEDF